MKKSPLLLLGSIILAGCTGTTTSANLEDQLKNPLFAERYAEAMVDRMVELQIRKDPLLEDESKRALVDETRKKWLEISREAEKKQRKGQKGGLIPLREFTQGEVLYLKNSLYVGTTFETDPGPSIHFFLTKMVDPRDGDFPDESSIDLGPIKTTFGAHSYSVPSINDPLLYRTAVIYDTKLERLYGFAQMTP